MGPPCFPLRWSALARSPERGPVRLVWIEAPGSTTMEVPNIPDIAGRAKAHGALVGCDSSWASPILCKPLELGADIVVEAITKYLSGHSDVLLGSISVGHETLVCAVYECTEPLGVGVSLDDCFLALRGIATAAVRLAHVGKLHWNWPNALQLRTAWKKCCIPLFQVRHTMKSGKASF